MERPDFGVDPLALAGVLGGFLITAIALLFDRSTKEAVHTLALFASAILILVLSSFLFSIITGTGVPTGEAARGICAIAWTQGAVSTASSLPAPPPCSAASAGCWSPTPSTKPHKRIHKTCVSSVFSPTSVAG